MAAARASTDPRDRLVAGLLAETGMFSPGHRLRHSPCFAFAQLRG
jgi:hypothetical protein